MDGSEFFFHLCFGMLEHMYILLTLLHNPIQIIYSNHPLNCTPLCTLKIYQFHLQWSSAEHLAKSHLGPQTRQKSKYQNIFGRTQEAGWKWLLVVEGKKLYLTILTIVVWVVTKLYVGALLFIEWHEKYFIRVRILIL